MSKIDTAIKVSKVIKIGVDIAIAVKDKLLKKK